MFKKTTQQGFTLIELLVVIAIIGILAATVLASLGTARSSGSDASTKGSINAAKAQAELFYNGTGAGTYTGFCGDATFTNLKTAIQTNSATTMSTASSTATVSTCVSTTTAWAVSAPLKTGGYFCADSSGFSGVGAAKTSTYLCY